MTIAMAALFSMKLGLTIFLAVFAGIVAGELAVDQWHEHLNKSAVAAARERRAAQLKIEGMLLQHFRQRQEQNRTQGPMGPNATENGDGLNGPGMPNTAPPR